MKTSSAVVVICLLVVSTSSAQKSFLKGLLIGSLLGHKKASMLHDDHNIPPQKEYHHLEHSYEPQKEFIPIPVEPKYIPIYIVKECPKMSSEKMVTHAHTHTHLGESMPAMMTSYHSEFPTNILQETEPEHEFAGQYSSSVALPVPVRNKSADNRQSDKHLTIDLSMN